jgi:hypothetical protein
MQHSESDINQAGCPISAVQRNMMFDFASASTFKYNATAAGLADIHCAP